MAAQDLRALLTARKLVQAKLGMNQNYAEMRATRELVETNVLDCRILILICLTDCLAIPYFFPLQSSLRKWPSFLPVLCRRSDSGNAKVLRRLAAAAIKNIDHWRG
jgi:hypothetical protein